LEYGFEFVTIFEDEIADFSHSGVNDIAVAKNDLYPTPHTLCVKVIGQFASVCFLGRHSL
jgi:hypothetical protein